MSAEEFVRTGTNGATLGVLTRAAATPRATGDGSPRTALVLLNAGLVHRVGPFRIAVDLARAAARAGIPAFRLDLPGVGDGGRPEEFSDGGSSPEEAAVAAALDRLEETGMADSFLLFGICSGAADAHRVARRDPRVRGVAAVDGYCYPTILHPLAYYLPRLTRPGAASRFPAAAARMLGRLTRRRAPRSRPAGDDLDLRDYLPRHEFAADVRCLVGRGTRLLLVQTTGVEERYAYAGQTASVAGIAARRVRPAGGGSCVVGTAGVSGRYEEWLRTTADHTFVLPSERDWLVSLVVRWATGGPPPV